MSEGHLHRSCRVSDPLPGRWPHPSNRGRTGCHEGFHRRQVRQGQQVTGRTAARTGDRRPRHVGADPGLRGEPARRQDHGGEFKLVLPYKPPFVLGNDLRRGRGARGARRAAVRAGRAGHARPDKDRIGTFAELIAIDEADLGAQACRADDGRGGVAAAGRAHSLAGAGGEGGPAARPEGPHPRGIRRRRDDSRSSWPSTWAPTSPRPPAPPTSTGYVNSARTVSLDYRREDFEQVLRDIDVVLDPSAARTSRSRCGVLRPCGLAIGIGGPPTRTSRRSWAGALLRPVLALLSRKVRRAARKNGCGTRFCSCEPTATSCGDHRAGRRRHDPPGPRPGLRLRRHHRRARLRRLRPDQGQVVVTMK